MANKLGAYISKLMTTVLDSEQEEFVKDLALNELTRLNVDINEFVRKHTKDVSDEIEKTEKQLLQEDKKNVKDK
jgi:predicted ATP-grasp superfamily ATP-dependent carboligase